MKVDFFSGESAKPELLEALPLLENTVKHADGDFSADDLERLVQNHKAVLGVVRSDEGEIVLAAVFEFVYYPQRTAINIMALAGHNLILAMDVFGERFREFCRQEGASVIEARCRPAMVRLLSHLGFHSSYQLVRLNL